MKTAIYCRVSTNDQTTENQKLAIEKYCELQGLTKLEVYEDVISGAKNDRPALNQLKQDVKAGKIKTLVVWKLDRLARSTMHLLQTLNFLSTHQVAFVSVTENVDTSTPAGKMLLTFLGAIAEFERELIRERVVAGLERAKSNNVKLGRPRKGFDVAKALELREEGQSYRAIAEAVGSNKATVQRVLSSVSKTLTEKS